MGCTPAADLRVVLIIDDDSVTCDYLAAVVEEVGYTPMVAHEGRRALSMTRSRAPALVITDLEMPKMGGAALIAALRAEWGAGLPVILVSAAPLSRLRAAGADAILAKPFPLVDLLALLDRFLLGGSAHHPAA